MNLSLAADYLNTSIDDERDVRSSLLVSPSSSVESYASGNHHTDDESILEESIVRVGVDFD